MGHVRDVGDDLHASRHGIADERLDHLGQREIEPDFPEQIRERATGDTLAVDQDAITIEDH